MIVIIWVSYAFNFFAITNLKIQGVSLDVKHQDIGNYQHQIPTGSCVIVSNVNPRGNEMLRFITFIKAVAQVAEKISNVKVPNHAKLRWESRTKGNNYLAFIHHSQQITEITAMGNSK